MLVALNYNDETQNIMVGFAGEVDDRAGGAIYANQRLPCLRSGAFLKDRYFKIRSLFSVAFKNWSRSGQNRPEGKEFANSVPTTPGTVSIYSKGRCHLVLFHELKCGTSAEDIELLKFTSRLTPGDVGNDDGEMIDEPSRQRGSSRKSIT